jgi:hypothetical protein
MVFDRRFRSEWIWRGVLGTDSEDEFVGQCSYYMVNELIEEIIRKPVHVTALAVKFFQKPGSMAKMGKLARC